MRNIFPVLMLIVLLHSSALSQELPGWGNLVDPVGDCPVDLNENGITLTIPAGVHQLNPTMQIVNAPRILQPIEGDFLYEVHVKDFQRPEANSGANGNRSYLAAGIVVWQDENNFLRWTRSASAEKHATYLSCEQFEGGQHVGGGYFKLKDQPVWLRVERRGKMLKMSASNDGKTWSEAIERDCTYADRLELGVFGLNVTQRDRKFDFHSSYLLK